MRGYVANLFGSRILAVLCIFGILMPTDAQNPHVIADTILAVIAGVVWAIGDLCVVELRLTKCISSALRSGREGD